MKSCSTTHQNEESDTKQQTDDINTDEKYAKIDHHQKTLIKSAINIDLTIYKQYDDNMNECNSTKTCMAIKRLICSLQYYSLLNIINDIKHRDHFTDFTNNIYMDLINDYTHLVNEHGGDLEEIGASYISDLCDIDKCVFTERHFDSNKDGNDDNIDGLDGVLTFYKNTMDSIHFFLFHLFHSGLRVKQEEKHDDAVDPEQEEKYFDAAFGRILNNINDRKYITANFNRFKSSNKYTLAVNKGNDNNNTGNKGSDNNTFLDSLYGYLLRRGFAVKCINKMCTLIDDEAYDTECVEYDICDNIAGNISNYVSNIELVGSIKQFFKSYQIQSTSFNVGLIFYYWPHYKSLKKADDINKGDVNEHGGYDIFELYVEQKHTSFKDEIMEYKQIEYNQYKEAVIKAKEYENSDIVRATKAAKPMSDKSRLFYDVSIGSILSFFNLLSLILYCDYSDLSREFSATFRPLQIFEPLTNIKARNREYWWWSKILRETVECFGRAGYDTDDEYEYEAAWNGGLFGPFFSGISCILAIPEFNIRLSSPTSTSSRIEVACKFSGDEGIVIQLNNSTDRFDWDCDLRAFNCSWISRYKEEDERLFFGGFRRIKIESIRLRTTTQNFEDPIKCIYYFDCMVTAAQFADEWGDKTKTIRSSDKNLLKKLIDCKLDKYGEETLDKYLYDTFECFCNHKKQISLKVDELYNYVDEDMIDLIMYGVNKTNLFRKNIVNIFSNITTVTIFTTSWEGKTTYSLSLLCLLELIDDVKLEHVEVMASQQDDDDRYNNPDYKKSWISMEWERSSKEIKCIFNEKSYSIKYKQIFPPPFDEQHKHHWPTEDWLFIDKM